ncbi:ADP-ribose pyrophosphatase [Endozoicomonas montiporae]|uniref:ADP-ribose pyrophosphatase n=2 Tax=Endozoicomonas montiporae TaxID=1027273 RepID=A0A081N5E2_9GAMM|nr:NUDIX hydrolase [Endozoicomonas montiporae]AMO57451.1 putative CDP-choline pyrophosphatase [Endozoicomonas montiporae CL-33]KEQ13665.1 ADP-ribose pyrophosphatase [Endozoicomonas montiporae]
MQDHPKQQWFEWVEQLRAIAQNGLAYADGEFDIERYHQLQSIAHDMTALLSGAPRSKVDHYFVGEHGYATPKLDIRAGVFKDDKILLVKERSDGCWAMPGGWADVCESPARGAERETLEESGYIVKVRKLVAVRDTQRHPYHPRNAYHLLKMLFLCELEGGSPKENIEISDIDFFDVKQLPSLSQGRTIADDVALMVRHRNQPDLPTEYD